MKILRWILLIFVLLFWGNRYQIFAGEPFVQYVLYRVDSTSTGVPETHIALKDTIDLEQAKTYKLYVHYLASNTVVNSPNDKRVISISKPAFVIWNDVFSNFGYEYTVTVPFSIDTRMSLPKTGRFSIQIVAQVLRDNSPDVLLADTTKFTFWVRPFIKDKPKFSRGLSDTIIWYPAGPPFSQEIISQVAPNHLEKMTDYRYQREVVFNNLSDGQRYSYYVKTLFQTEGGLVELHSDTVYSVQDASPPTKTTLDSVISYNLERARLYWKGAADSSSFIKAYHIYRMRDNDSLTIRLIATIPAKDTIGADDSYYSFVDYPADPPTESYAYQVRAVDAVGNEGEGEFSGPVIKLPVPKITAWYDWSTPDFSWIDYYKQGVTNTIYVQDFRPGNENQILYPPDSIRFQAIRDSLKYFPIRWEPGKQFFESRYQQNGKTTSWIPLSHFAYDSIRYTFDLSNNGQNDGNYINHHRYHFRVQYKDHFGNYSAWSDTVWERQDVFPPDDIDLNIIQPVVVGDTAGYMLLSWKKPSDSVTGVAYYFIYRKIGEDGTYTLIDTTTQTSYQDPFDSIGTNKVVYYKVGSIDRVGNERQLDQIADEESAKCLAGPTLRVLGKVISYRGNLYTKDEALNFYWENFIKDDIYKYEVQVSGVIDSSFYLTDPSVSNFIWSLPQLGTYSVRVRAIYSVGDQSIWSRPFVVTKAGPPSDFHLVARNDSLPAGQIYLSWQPNSEILPVKLYEIYRWGNEETPVKIAAISMDSLQDSIQTAFVDADTSVPVYKCLHYRVKATNLLDLTKDSNSDSTYFNRAPKILPENTVVSPGEMKIFWTRPNPNLSTNWGNVVRIFKEEETSPVKIDTVFGKNSYSFFNPEKGFVYRFQVKEFPAVLTDQMCSNQTVETAWSAEETIPYIKYPPIQDVKAQALPAPPPIQAQPEAGQVYLAWQNKKGQPRVTPTTGILLFRDGTQIASLAPTVHDFLDTNLTVGHAYAYNVVTFDQFGQKSSSDTVHVSLTPYWAYTPQVKPAPVTYFKDTVRVNWGWLNAALKWTDKNYGADSCQVGVSIDPAFKHHTATSAWQKADAGMAKLARPYFVTLNNHEVYLRVRAKDRWGHLSPWSNAYFGLDSAKVDYDGVPPVPVSGLKTDSTKASTGTTDSVDVFLSWKASTDNISGVAGYYIRRSDSLVAEIPVQQGRQITFVDREVPVDGILNQYWQVFPFDRAGNIQSQSDTARVHIQLYAPIPHPNSVRSCSWEPIQTPFGQSEYWVEMADSVIYFDSPLAALFVKRSGWITASSFVDSMFQSNDGTSYFRLKVRVQTIESGWSPIVRYPSNGWEIARSSRGREAFFKKYGIPKSFRLYQNYPNPFNMHTNITYDLPKEGQVRVEIWNILGMKVATLENRFRKPGSYVLNWTGRNANGEEVGTGIYFYTIRVSNSGQVLFQRTAKLLLVK